MIGFTSRMLSDSSASAASLLPIRSPLMRASVPGSNRSVRAFPTAPTIWYAPTVGSPFTSDRYRRVGAAVVGALYVRTYGPPPLGVASPNTLSSQYARSS